MRIRHGMSLAGMAIAALLCAAGPAHADFAERPDRFELQIGATAAELTTEAGLGVTNGGIGASINFEDAFNLPISKSAARVDGTWRFGERHHLDFGYVKFNRSAATVIDQDIHWGDYIFQQDAYVAATFDSDFPYAAYRYDFLHLDQVRISGSAGLSDLHLGAELEANGMVTDSGGTQVTVPVSQAVSIRFPVPLFGLQLDWALRRHLMLTFFTRELFIDFAGIKGGVGEHTVRLTWVFSKHVGIAGGIDRTNVILREYEKDNYKARFGYTTQGVSGYLSLHF